ncbi:hypothetical protein HAX54_018189 [Datura stramonium]|uniref:Uncharacterized protein n=1 Tax=Datura stramonium TaxID=4076 RepID=A0ABS8UNX2_DATST|nr:hypothetical protein [Datura stramonium]
MLCLRFGFDHKTHDFKVIRIAYLRGANGGYMEVEAHKLSTGLWTTVYSKAINSKLDINYSSIYLNGAIIGFPIRRMKVAKLLVFDLSDETFSEMGSPRVLA